MENAATDSDSLDQEQVVKVKDFENECLNERDLVFFLQVMNILPDGASWSVASVEVSGQGGVIPS